VGRRRPGRNGAWPGARGDPILQRHQLKLDDIDRWEINEAFAAQVLACLAAWASDDYCRQELGLPGALGVLPPERLNVDGSAIAIGHPVGASGARIVLHLLQALRAAGARRGIAAICVGGGQGGAMLLETISQKQTPRENP
jgi:acetyl-CoA C-acetyltransferase